MGILSGPAAGVLSTAHAELTNAQVLALGTAPYTPHQIVAAPGAGRMLVPTWWTLTYNCGSIPFTVTGDGTVKLTTAIDPNDIASDAWESANGILSLITQGTFAHSHECSTEGYINGEAGTVFVNRPLSIGCAASDLADGNGTMAVTILYFTLTV